MKLINKIKLSEFSSNTLKLFSGTVVANLIYILTLPILTRLYAKEDFGLFQLFTSIVLTLSVISSFKYEMAIVLPKKGKDANHIILLAIFFLFFTTICISILFFIFSSTLLNFFNAENLKPYMFLISIGIFATGLVQLTEYIWIRNKKFSKLGTNKIYRNSTTQALSVFYGYYDPQFLGLVISQIAGQLLAAFLILRNEKYIFSKIAFSRLIDLAKNYKKFALINTPMVFLNTLSLELPVFMFAKYHNPEIVGLFMAARRLIYRPLNLIGKSISQVFLQSAADAYNQGNCKLMILYKKTIQKLSFVGIIPIAIVAFAGPELVSFFLGSDWIEAGVFMQIMTFWIYFQFINAPVSSTFSIINRQEISFILIGISLLIRFFAMYFFREDYLEMLIALSISAGSFYLFFNIAIYFSLRKLKC